MFKYNITLYNGDIPITTYAREAANDEEVIELARHIQATLVEVIENNQPSPTEMRLVIENIEGNTVAEL